MFPQLFWSLVSPFLEFIDQCTVCCRELLFYLWLKSCHLNGKSSLSCLQLPCLGLGDLGGLLGGLPPQVFPPPPYLSGTFFWLFLSVYLQVSLPQPFSQYFPLTNYLSIPLYICPLLTLSNGPSCSGSVQTKPPRGVRPYPYVRISHPYVRISLHTDLVTLTSVLRSFISASFSSQN